MLTKYLNAILREVDPLNDDDNLKIQHKDSFFRGLFKVPEHFLYLLDRCSSGSLNFSPGELTNFNLKSDHANRARYNDVSFLTKDNRLLILIEHQSRISSNMALRMFIYYHDNPNKNKIQTFQRKAS